MINEPHPWVPDAQKVSRKGFLDVVVTDDHFKIRKRLCANRGQGLFQQIRPIVGSDPDGKERRCICVSLAFKFNFRKLFQLLTPAPAELL